MNNLVINWLYLIASITVFYWLLIAGMYYLPNIPPIIISLVIMLVIYYFTKQRNIILFV